ncbi:MAG: toprim domain-containing protein [Desulfobacterales bacterium]|nr:toprim domain-containing protein [Desulfobacterales bacterium]
MISQERIDAVKKGIDIKSYIESRGIALKKQGRSYVGLCQFHKDIKPSLSVTPDKQLFNCFGCGASGDVIKFVMMSDKVEFKEAVEKLEEKVPYSESGQASSKNPEQSQPINIKDKRLLSRVVSYYQKILGEDRRGVEYLKEKRGINSIQTLKDFGIGFVNGNLKQILPEDKEVIENLKKIGILNDKGNESFYNCVVFPLYDVNGSVVGLYGRNITDENSINHLYLAGPKKGIINRQAVKISQTIILTESVIDALTLYDQGVKNVIPAYGVNGLIDEHIALFHKRIKEVYIVFDADEAGLKGAEAVSVRLKEKEIVSYIVNLPVKDVNIFFKRQTPEEFEALLKNANPKSLEQSENVIKRKQSLYKEIGNGFIVGYSERQYHMKGIQRGDTQLKVTIKASKDVEGNVPFELSTIDMYSSRSRIWFGKLCADLFSASEELIREDLGKILNLCEEFKPKTREKGVIEVTEEERSEAENFLKNPKMFEEILSDIEIMGVVGEEINKIICYLTAVSRKLDKPLSSLIQSRSGAGKSTLQNTIIKLMPEEEYEQYTRVTDQALFYKEEDSLVHKILAIEEEAGVGGAAYSIRNIQSCGKISVATTGKDPATGKMKTEKYTVEGPVAVMLTTTSAELDQETASRFLSLSIDESTQMTSAIHDKQREARTIEGLIKKKRTEKIKKNTKQRKGC